jgi:hypothetical protein
MYKLLVKNGQLFALLLGIVAFAIIFISAIVGLNGAGYDMSTDLNQVLKDNPGMSFSYFNPLIVIAGSMIVIAALAWVVFSIVQMLGAPKASIRSIISFGALIIIFLLFYFMSQPEKVGGIWETIQKFNITDNVSRFISGGLKTTLTLAIVAFGAMVVFEILNLFK